MRSSSPHLLVWPRVVGQDVGKLNKWIITTAGLSVLSANIEKKGWKTDDNRRNNQPQAEHKPVMIMRNRNEKEKNSNARVKEKEGASARSSHTSHLFRPLASQRPRMATTSPMTTIAPMTNATRRAAEDGNVQTDCIFMCVEYTIDRCEPLLPDSQRLYAPRWARCRRM